MFGSLVLIYIATRLTSVAGETHAADGHPSSPDSDDNPGDIELTSATSFAGGIQRLRENTDAELSTADPEVLVHRAHKIQRELDTTESCQYDELCRATALRLAPMVERWASANKAHQLHQDLIVKATEYHELSQSYDVRYMHRRSAAHCEG